MNGQNVLTARVRAGVFTAVAMPLSAGCLLTTSLDGLEGLPVTGDGGGFDVTATDDAGRAEAGANADAMIDRLAEGPIGIAPSGDIVRGLAERGGDVYWAQGDPNGGIVRAPKIGGGTPAFVHVSAETFDVAVDDTHVYWSTGTGNEVFRKRLDATASVGELLFSGAGETLYLALGAAGRVYATGANAVVVGPIGDAGMSWLHYGSQTGAAGIASNAGNLFWSVEAAVVRGDESGQTARPIFSVTPSAARGLATDGQEIFWMEEGGSVRAMSVVSPVPPPARYVCTANLGSASALARDVAIDDAWVYFAEPALRRISKCPKR
jgi:hypothetical protein